MSERPQKPLRNRLDTRRVKRYQQADVEKRTGKEENGGYVFQNHAAILPLTHNEGCATSH
jgi:hypothetical protein